MSIFVFRNQKRTLDILEKLFKSLHFLDYRELPVLIDENGHLILTFYSSTGQKTPRTSMILAIRKITA